MAEAESGAATGAAQGAVIGSVVPGIGTAIGAGVGAVAGYLGGMGSKRSRQAAERAAMERQRQVQEYYNYQHGLADQIATAMNDPMEMNALSNALGSQERQLARQEQMIQAIDPALKEAAMQAFKLMRGEESSSLAPLRAERQRQRQSLVNTLRAQLGPGAENSSAGQQALNRFDAESSNVLASQQQSSLTGLLGSAQQTRAGINMGHEAGTLADLSGRRMSRVTDGVVAQNNLMRGAFEAKTKVAGSQFIGASMKGSFMQGLGGQLMGSLGAAASSYLGGQASSAASSPSVTSNKNLLPPSAGMPGMDAESGGW